jgi:hypothetical protein
MGLVLPTRPNTFVERFIAMRTPYAASQILAAAICISPI